MSWGDERGYFSLQGGPFTCLYCNVVLREDECSVCSKCYEREHSDEELFQAIQTRLQQRQVTS